MPMPEFGPVTWSLSSTGASTQVVTPPSLLTSQQITVIADMAAAGDTGVFGIEHARTSTSAFVRMGSTAYSVSSGGSVTVQLSGPLYAVRPYLISRTSTTAVMTIQMVGV